MARDAILRRRWRLRGAGRCAVLGALVAAAALGPTASPAATGWGTVSSPGADGLATPSLALAGTQVIGTWPINGGLNQWSAETSTFTPLTDGTALAASGKRIPLVSGWAGMGPVVLAGSTSPGGYQAMITGGAATPGPLDGTDFAQRNADGSWGPLINTGLGECGTCSSAVTAIAAQDGQTPMFVNNYGGSLVVFRGATGLGGTTGTNLSGAFGGSGGVQASYPTFGRDTSGRYWLAWYNSIAPLGLAVVQIDPATGSAIGMPSVQPAAAWMPFALACGATCRLVYHGLEPDGSNLARIRTWWPGDPAATTINAAGERVGNGVGAAYTHDGKLWVVWYDDHVPTYHAVLGDARGAGGTVQTLGIPAKGNTDLAGLMGGVALANDSLVVVANWNANGSPQFWSDVVPASIATPAPGPRVVELQTGAGGKGFRIQVQFDVPKSCSKPCTGSAELQTRNGRRLYAVTPLPGDGKVVLGRRSGIPLFKGVGKKVRFYLTVSKAELLRAPFSTQGGDRLAQTRLRVTVRSATGSALYVRDGQIKVSIARIKSGALPGLNGIL
jgi:hypothetical protein